MAEGPRKQVLGVLAPRHWMGRGEFGSVLQGSIHRMYKVDYSLSARLRK